MKIFTALMLQLVLAVHTLAQECDNPVFPNIISYRASNFDHTPDATCSPFASDIDAPLDVNPTEYLRCNGQTAITDANTGPPFYIWGEAPGRLLFDFGTVRNLTSIIIHYQYNDTYALPKLRIYAAPDNFQVWDEPSASFPSQPFDEIGPGSAQGEDGIRQLPDPLAESLQFVTSRVLIDKLEDTKNFLFAFSEVSFQESCPQGTDPSTTAPATTTQVATDSETSTQTTDSPETTTQSTDGQFGSAGKSYGNCMVILTMLAWALCLV